MEDKTMSCAGMPEPGEQHRKLQALAGTWVGEETLYPSPWDQTGGSATGRMEGRMGLDGFFLIGDYTQERGGQVTYRGHGVYGYDAGQGCWTLNWFDSMGGGAWEPSRGTWEGNVLTFSQQNPMGHGRYIYTFESEGRYRFRIEQSQDGKSWAPFMDSVYTRR
jgi:hypothetical protein